MPKGIRVNGERFVPLISERRIKGKTRELARRLNRDYQGTVPLFLGILNGSFIFFADLIREITLECEVDFLKLSSYRNARRSSGRVRMLKGLQCDVKGRDVVIVEDIVDSGRSLRYMRRLVGDQNPKSLRVVTLLYKDGVPGGGIIPEYVGFVIPPEFVIGYGLDYAQRKRNLKSIYRLTQTGASQGDGRTKAI